MILKISKNMKLAFLALALIAVAGIAIAQSSGGSDLPTVTVYKSPTCGCCAKWVDHLEENGFDTEVVDQQDVTPTKFRYGLPHDLSSCHTAVVDGYVVEGHVPADVIKRMVEERPQIAGLAVPGMPIGSPGMEHESRKDDYDIIAFTKDGKKEVYASR